MSDLQSDNAPVSEARIEGIDRDLVEVEVYADGECLIRVEDKSLEDHGFTDATSCLLDPVGRRKLAEALVEGLTDAEGLIAAEIARQDRMWGALNERADTSKGQLHLAGLAQLNCLLDKQNGEKDPFAADSAFYPNDWSGLRDYGSDIANLVVAAAFITQEVRRKLRAGEDTTRTSRNPDTQPYTADQPAVVEA